MVLESTTGSVFRLVVRFPEHDVVFEASPFATYKQAVAHVTTAVRRHAGEGAIQNVLLQRSSGPILASPASASCTKR